MVCKFWIRLSFSGKEGGGIMIIIVFAGVEVWIRGLCLVILLSKWTFQRGTGDRTITFIPSLNPTHEVKYRRFKWFSDCDLIAVWKILTCILVLSDNVSRSSFSCLANRLEYSSTEYIICMKLECQVKDRGSLNFNR